MLHLHLLCLLPESLLSRSVPQLKLDLHLGLDVQRARIEIHADRGVRHVAVDPVREALQQRRLPHRRIPEQNDSELVLPQNIHGMTLGGGSSGANVGNKAVAAACLRSRRPLLLLLRKSAQSCDGSPLLRCSAAASHKSCLHAQRHDCALKAHVSRCFLRLSCGGFKRITAKFLQKAGREHEILSKVSPEIIPQRRIILKARRDGACMFTAGGRVAVRGSEVLQPATFSKYVSI